MDTSQDTELVIFTQTKGHLFFATAESPTDLFYYC